MNKKIILIIVAAAIVFIGIIAVVCISNKKSEYPQIAYIDDEIYYCSDKIVEMVPRQMPDGIIDTFVDAQIMPDMYNSANFGSKYGSLEYMFLEDGQLIIHVGENWYYASTQMN